MRARCLICRSLHQHDFQGVENRQPARPDLLEKVRALAAEEGRQFQAVLGDALGEWVAKKKGEAPRHEVIGHLKASIATTWSEQI